MHTARWLIIQRDIMGAQFLDLESIDKSHEPQLLEVMNVSMNPTNGELRQSRWTFALWCETRQVAVRHHWASHESKSGPPERFFIRHPVEDDDFPATPGRMGTGPRLNTPSRLARVVCDGLRLNPNYVEDPVAWVQEHMKYRDPPL